MLESYYRVSEPRSDHMIRAYTEELTARMQEVDTCKARMEKWYAGRLEDHEVVGDQKDEYDHAMTLADATIADTNKSIKMVKNALVPHQEEFPPKKVR